MSTLPRTEAPAELSKPGLVLLWGNSPNGWKPTYLLEALKEAGSIPEYTVVEVNLSVGVSEQFQDWFVAVNPNSKMPALLDNRGDGKPPLRVFESASILLYLAKKFDTACTFHFKDEQLEAEMISWVFWTQANLGPTQGQVNHFTRYASGEPQTYSINRFNAEVHRQYQVLDDHLSGKHDRKPKQYIVGGKPSLADFCTQPWVRCAFWGGIDLTSYPSVQAWHDRIEALPFVQRALQVPVQDTRVRTTPGLEEQLTRRVREAREKQERAEKGEGQ
ncbi:hypothetical protein JCM10213_004100 [Rhodosporidiobolus nylandii]